MSHTYFLTVTVYGVGGRPDRIHHGIADTTCQENPNQTDHAKPECCVVQRLCFKFVTRQQPVNCADSYHAERTDLHHMSGQRPRPQRLVV